MDETFVRVTLTEGASVPEYRSAGAAGADLRAFIDSPILLAPGERTAVPTGLRIAIPEGYEAQVRSRSGLALGKGLICLNSPGTIDSDYRGEIKVILANLGMQTAEILPGDRIAQLVIARYSRAEFAVSSDLGLTERGADGFGSTGR